MDQRLSLSKQEFWIQENKVRVIKSKLPVIEADSQQPTTKYIGTLITFRQLVHFLSRHAELWNLIHSPYMLNNVKWQIHK